MGFAMMTMRHDPIDWARWIIDGAVIVFWHRRRGSLHWPVTNGTVEYWLTSDADGWRTNLVYSNSVSGEFYSGAHALTAKNEAAADEQARRWKDQNLVVRYSPRDPSISVIRIDEQAPFLAKGTFRIG